MADFDCDSLIERLKKGEIIEESLVSIIINKAKEIFFLENNLILLRSPIIICGDVHGQLEDVINMIDLAGGADQNRFLFMGDYVDRGNFSLDTFLMLLCYMIKRPNDFFLLRGNHEDMQTSQMYGFYNEICSNYGNSGIWFLCNDLFQYIPLAAVVDDEIFVVHGGLSPLLKDVGEINSINRKKSLPSDGIMADLLWSDPEERCGEFRRNSRGSGYIFGRDQTKEFLSNNKLQKVIRSHQMVKNGYQYYFGDGDGSNKKLNDGMLLLVWSAPNYAYKSGNKATFLKFKYDDSKPYDLIEFREVDHRLPIPEKYPTSNYFA